MIYDTGCDYYWWFLKDAQKAENKWEKKFGSKNEAMNSDTKMSYIDFINNHTV